jgi:WXG100 family type VII secretion target
MRETQIVNSGGFLCGIGCERTVPAAILRTGYGDAGGRRQRPAAGGTTKASASGALRGSRRQTNRERKPVVANVNVTYADMQSAANQLRSGEQQIQGDLAKLKKLIDNLVASGYVTDSSSKQFEASYTQFNTGATKMIEGLNGMGQYLDSAAKAFHETDTQLAASLKGGPPTRQRR